MKLYAKLSELGFLRTYAIKFLFLTFLGVHVPLMAIIIYIAKYGRQSMGTANIITFTLVLTLGATCLTLFFLNRLIKPIKLANRALRDYINHRKLPQLPIHYKDELGVLLRGIQTTVTSVDDLLNEKKDMVTMLSHDLRTPTITTLDTIRLLRHSPEERTTDNLLPYLENLEEVNKKQLALVDSVLTLLKQDDLLGRDLITKRVSLGLLVRNTILQLQLPLANKGLQVKQEIPKDLVVKVEPTLFEQVLSNLLINAVKFSHPGQTIVLQAENTNKGTKLHFKDNGLGFVPENSDRLFDRFTKCRQVGTQGETTNGIGLFLCQKIMHQHGGYLSAHSAGEGQGATFTVHLPRQ